MQEIRKDALFLIDGSSFLYRAYYGLRPLHTSTGVPVQATYGFCRTIKKLIDDFNPQNIVLVWDSQGKTSRSEMYTEYKATRQEAPSDLAIQKEQIEEFADLIGLCQVKKTGYEADDLIASLVKEHPNKQIIVISPDKDLQQLISDNVLVYDPLKKELIDRESFIEKRGFAPEHLLLYHALLGDTSDNIPGVRGIGKKTAGELVKEFKTLKQVYQNLDSIEKERIRKALIAHKKEAFLSEKLFTLIYVKTGITEQDFPFDRQNLKKALPFFTKLEFKSFIKELNKKTGEEEIQIKNNWRCIIVQTEDELQKLIVKIKKKKLCAFDVETTGLRPMIDRLVGISFAIDKKDGYYIPCSHINTEGEAQLSCDYIVQQIKPFMEDSAIKKTVHYGKFDVLVLMQSGIETHGIVFDSLLAASLLRKAWQKIGLKALSSLHLNEPMRTFKQVMDKKYKTFDEVPIKQGAEYGAHDSLQTFKLKELLEKELAKEPKLKKLFDIMELPLSKILVKMERFGIMLDAERLQSIGRDIEKELNKMQRKTLAAISAGRKKEADEEINLNSPKQVEKLLFDELKLPAMKLSKEGRRSTDSEVLSELAKVHPVPGMILKYRELFKLKSTYCDPLPHEINPRTGRIHTTYNQTDVATGRLSSYRPNLQNIPATSGFGIAIRSTFVAPRGRRFLSADYSQIDLRVLSHLSKDENLKQAFIEDRDIHRQTAAEIYGIASEKVTSEQRQVGKRINFSIIYGLTPFGLAKDLGIKPNEAKEYIEKYFAQYPRVGVWMERVVEQAKQDGYVETYFGRRRYVPQLQERNRTVYEQARRVTVNTPVQGTSAEIIKLAMIEIDKAFTKKKLDAAMVLQLHDELIIEFVKDQEKSVENVVRDCMEHIVDWDVSMKVVTRVGKNWQEVTK